MSCSSSLNHKRPREDATAKTLPNKTLFSTKNKRSAVKSRTNHIQFQVSNLQDCKNVFDNLLNTRRNNYTVVTIYGRIAISTLFRALRHAIDDARRDSGDKKLQRKLEKINVNLQCKYSIKRSKKTLLFQCDEITYSSKTAVTIPDVVNLFLLTKSIDLQIEAIPRRFGPASDFLEGGVICETNDEEEFIEDLINQGVLGCRIDDWINHFPAYYGKIMN